MNLSDTYGLLKNSEKVSDKSIQLMSRYCIRRPNRATLRLADCLIAAFAVYHKMELLTFNEMVFIILIFKIINLSERELTKIVR